MSVRRAIAGFFGILMMSVGPLLAGLPQNDTILIEDVPPETNFEQNLDSLLNLWYVKQSLEGTEDILTKIDSIIPDFPDSVYIERLSNIPSVIELSYNRVVKNYINVYTKKKRENLEVMLGLSEYYFPIFDEIFDYYDLPNELKYMAIIESALNPRAVSRAGATGLWQFMYGTGRMYNLIINSLVDERRDPIKSTHAAARYLSDLHNIYKDWVLVIAAYNCGPGNVNKAIRRSGNKRNYWDIYYYLPRETRGYMPAFIAATYAFNYYEDHSLVPREISLPVAVDTIMINEELHLSQVSEVMQIPLKQLSDLNPQYRRNIIPAKGVAFALTLPLEHSTRFIELQDSIFAYQDNKYFNEENRITNPTYSSYLPSAPTGKVKLTYSVKSGDNLGYISQWYNVRVSDLRYWNNIRRNLIRSGQRLNIYVSPANVEKYRPINSMTFAEKQRLIGKPVNEVEVIENTSGSTDVSFVYYRVKSGDTLWEIAQKFPGVTDSDIIRLNNLSNGNKIKPGQTLKIMKKG